MPVLSFSLQVGIGLRSKTRQEIEAYCFRNNLICEFYEQKGFLESILHFKIIGSESEISEFRNILNAWIASNNT